MAETVFVVCDKVRNVVLHGVFSTRGKAEKSLLRDLRELGITDEHQLASMLARYEVKEVPVQ